VASQADDALRGPVVSARRRLGPTTQDARLSIALDVDLFWIEPLNQEQ
jgi:hypothetical protein